jgi:NAD(P)-dependent dehydrogenase (short-subunit alcohol dehydrogenase family)
MSRAVIPDLWDEAHAAGFDEPGLLLYRSNLLGSDLRVTNFGGGNTSAQVDELDPLTGEMVKVLWVKGSGGDLGSIKRDGFATLYLDRLESLKSHYRGLAHEDEMVHKLPYCTFDLNPRAASIDTPLHAFVPYAHVDHMHPDAAIEDTSLALWNRNMDILGAGYFLTSRAAFRVMKRQGIGGSIVFIVSKNGLAASPGASAYCAAKALELHLARCLALEGAACGIRVNSVNPDAVLRGSKIWQGEWRDQRAQSNKVTVDELEEVYRQRSLLKLSVYPEDVAEAAYFLASDAAAKSTGNIINVDAGNAVSFTR